MTPFDEATRAMAALVEKATRMRPEWLNGWLDYPHTSLDVNGARQLAWYAQTLSEVAAFVPAALEHIELLQAELEQARRKARAFDWMQKEFTNGLYRIPTFDPVSVDPECAWRFFTANDQGPYESLLEAIEAAVESEVPR